MAYDTQVVECVRDEHEGHASADAPREHWSWTAWSSAVTTGVLGFFAVCIVVSAITVVSRQPFGDTGVVLPTGPGHDPHRATATPVERNPDSSACHQGPLGCAAEQPTRDRTIDSPAECAATAAAPEAKQHPTVDQSFQAQ